MSTRRASDVFIVGLWPPPVVDGAGFDALVFQLLDNRDGFEGVIPGALIRVNQIVRLACAISAVKDRRARRVRADDFVAPARTVRGLRARREELSKFRKATIHFANLN